MISPYKPNNIQRIIPPKIIIKGKRKIRKDNNKKIKNIKRKCYKIKYSL